MPFRKQSAKQEVKRCWHLGTCVDQTTQEEYAVTCGSKPLTSRTPLLQTQATWLQSHWTKYFKYQPPNPPTWLAAVAQSPGTTEACVKQVGSMRAGSTQIATKDEMSLAITLTKPGSKTTYQNGPTKKGSGRSKLPSRWWSLGKPRLKGALRIP